MKIIGLTGKARAGKDTIGKHLVAAHGYATYAMASQLKAMLGAIGYHETNFQTTEEKEAVIPELGVSYRHMAQTLGTDWMRKSVNARGWLILAEKALDSWQRNSTVEGVVITDVRFDNEAVMVRELGGTVIHVLSNRDSGMTDATKGHESEQGVTFVEGDKTLYNFGDIPQLHLSVDAIFGNTAACL